MKIFGNPMSTCTRKVLMTLAEKGKSADLVAIDFAKGEHKAEPHLARQPYGQIPTLEDDGFAFYESRAMMRYLDAKFPEPALAPADIEGRAIMDQWMSVEQSNFSPAALKIITQLVFAPMFGGQPNGAVVAEGKAATSKSFGILDAHLAKHEYLAGNFGLADICYMPYLEYLEKSGVAAELLAPHAHVAAWWSKIRARPTWQKVVG